MPQTSLTFRFKQPFRVSAQEAFDWCTDFREEDAKKFPFPLRRTIRWLTPDALLMTDVSFPEGKRRRVQRLVRINAAERSWTNTHVSGPFTHSQYWYSVVPDGPRRSHLEFRGLRIITTPKKLDRKTVERLTQEERQGDATLWGKYLGPALERDLGR